MKYHGFFVYLQIDRLKVYSSKKIETIYVERK